MQPNVYLIAHAVIVRSDGAILVLQRSSDNDVLPNQWDVPGGSCESGEDPMATAIRETEEETGLTIADPRLFAYTSNVDPANGIQFVRFIFRAAYRSNEIHLNPREHQAYAWIDPRHLDDRAFVDYIPGLCKQLLQVPF